MIAWNSVERDFRTIREEGSGWGEDEGVAGVHAGSLRCGRGVQRSTQSGRTTRRVAVREGAAVLDDGGSDRAGGLRHAPVGERSLPGDASRSRFRLPRCTTSSAASRRRQAQRWLRIRRLDWNQCSTRSVHPSAGWMATAFACSTAITSPPASAD